MHLLRVFGDFSLGIDTGPVGTRTDIAPFVGIRHDGIETRLQELSGFERDPWVMTVAANVGYVLGTNYLAWQPPSEAAEVLTSIDAALDRLRPLLDLDRLADVWDLKGTRDPSWRYREILLLLLRGDRDKAMDRLVAARGEFCQTESPICERFRRFEARLIEWLKQPRASA